MDRREPFGYSFFQIIGSLIVVGVAGIALINHLLTDYLPLIGL
jgi:hypothetical protein